MKLNINIISVLTTIFAVIFPLTVKAIEDHSHLTVEGVVYELNSNGTAEIVGYTDELPGRLTVPEQISDGEIDYTVTAVRDSAFLNSKIWWIDLPASIRSIGTAAFQDPDGNWILDLMTLRSPEPPELGDQVFFPDNYEQYTQVYVDDRVYEKYATNPRWVKTSLHCGYAYEIDGLYYRILDREAETAELIQIPQSRQLSDFLGYESVPERLPDLIDIDGKIYNVISIGDNSLSISNMRQFIVGANISHIGRYAFYRSGLSSISFEHTANNPLQLGVGCFEMSGLGKIELPEGLTKLSAGLLIQCQLSELSIPSTVSEIEMLAFDEGISTIIVKAQIPPVFEYPTGIKWDYGDSDCLLYVPQGTLQAYSEADGWRDFPNIVEMGSGIDGVEADAAERLTVSGEVYSAAGARLRSVSDPQGVTAAGCCEGLPAGVYVVCLTDTAGRTTAVRTAVR